MRHTLWTLLTLALAGCGCNDDTGLFPDPDPDPNPQVVVIGGTVFQDLTPGTLLAGALEPADPRLVGTIVRLFSMGAEVAQTLTDDNGEYRFDDTNVTGGLTPNVATYDVRIDLLDPTIAGGTPVPPDSYPDEALDSEGATGVAPGFVVAPVVTPGPGESDVTIHFGFRIPTPPVLPDPQATLGGIVFQDNLPTSQTPNALDPGDGRLAGVQVLVFQNNAQIATVPTDAQGAYVFAQASPGVTYEFRIDLTDPAIANGTPVPANANANEAIDSEGLVNVVPGFVIATGMAPSVSQPDVTIHFGFRVPNP